MVLERAYSAKEASKKRKIVANATVRRGMGCFSKLFLE